jgi:hypothetical protein
MPRLLIEQQFDSSDLHLRVVIMVKELSNFFLQRTLTFESSTPKRVCLVEQDFAEKYPI